MPRVKGYWVNMQFTVLDTDLKFDEFFGLIQFSL